MLKALISLFSLSLFLFTAGFAQKTKIVWLDSLETQNIELGWGLNPNKNKSIWGTDLKMGGKVYARGLGIFTNTLVRVKLNGGSRRFTAELGLDDLVKTLPGINGTSEAILTGDGKTLWKSPLMRAGDAAQKIDVNVTGVNELKLWISDAGDGWNNELVDLANATFEVTGALPQIYRRPRETEYILTPKPPLTPRINGAKVFGARPGAPFLYTIAATGERPMQFNVKKLPPGLRLDRSTGRIYGRVTKPGDYLVQLIAKNKHGQAARDLRIKIGEEIALTPPMGWSTWNGFGPNIDQEKVMKAVDILEDSGLQQHGWTYVNIDDAWQGKRGGPYNAIQPDEERFPDFKRLIDYIHSKGFKAGNYSTPWKKSYAGFIGGSADNADGTITKFDNSIGKFKFHEQDVRQWAEWGIDYMKYDWAPNDVEHTKLMSDAMRRSGRDMVFSISNTAPFALATEWARLTNLWRTTGDIFDQWNSIAAIGFQQSPWAPYAKPGHWNDADMLVVGYLGIGKDIHQTRLTPNEQYTHISLWSLLASPLLIGCDLTKLDDFTLNLLTNDEVLAVDQDPLGVPARRITQVGETEVWARPLEDGSKAVGLFNRSENGRQVKISWHDLGISGNKTVRDLWRQQDLGKFAQNFSADVPAHGVVLVRIY